MKGGRVPSRRLSKRGDLGATRVHSGVAASLFALLLWQGVSAGHESVGQDQERDCTLVKVGGYTVSRLEDSVNYSHRASGGIDYRCTDGTRILADSAVVWERSGNVRLVERVHFEDADTELDADSAYYFGNTRELRAWSGVTLTDRKSGAVLTGDSLNFQRESRFRTMDRIRVYGGDPRAVVYPARRPAAPVAGPEPVEVAAAPDSLTEELPDEPAIDSLSAELPDEPAIDSLSAELPGEPAIDSLSAESPGVSPEESPTVAPPEVAEEMSGDEAAVPADSVTPTPYEVAAPRLYIDGRRFFRGGGGVVVTRDSLQAFGDSLDYDQEVGAMLIFGNARVVDRGFELRGASVSVTPAAGLNEEILAREDAELTGAQVLMEAPAIRLFLEDGQVRRIVALPSVVPMPGHDGEELADTTGLTPGDVARARALAEAARREAEGDSVIVPDSLPRPSVVAADFSLTGDSLEVLSPNQLLDVVTAVGGARAEAMNQDSVPGEDLPEVVANDWIEGRTIVARFTPEEPAQDSVAASRDTTAGRVRLESVTAITDARSLYRVLASDTARAESDTVTTASETALAASDSAGPETGAAGAESRTPPAETGMNPDETDVPPAATDTLQGEEARPPALHYVRGNQITIHMEGQKVVKMQVQGQTVGYHFEPLPPDSLPAVEDSALAALDTVGAAADTADAAPDTTVTAADTTRTPPDTTRVPTAARRETPRRSGSNSFRHGFQPPLHHRRPGARE